MTLEEAVKTLTVWVETHTGMVLGEPRLPEVARANHNQTEARKTLQLALTKAGVSFPRIISNRKLLDLVNEKIPVMNTTKSITDRDTNGDTADAVIKLIGGFYRHALRGKVYEVIGYCWIGDLDQWGVMHSAPGDPVFVRSYRNFTGNIETPRDEPTQPRFELTTAEDMGNN